MSEQQYNIDVLISWVNPNDASWYEAYRNACAIYKGDKSPQRIRDFGTFRYLLRSIEKNMPWVNKVHLFVYDNSQIPDWLNLSYPRLDVHTHNEVCKHSFNQLYFSRYFGCIPRLAEHFIYLCDDHIILNKMDAKEWFINGIPTDDATETTVIASNPPQEEYLKSIGMCAEIQVGTHQLDFFQRIVKNTIFLASVIPKQLKIYKNHHTGISCIKSEYQYYMDALSKPLDKMFNNFMFRNDNQVIPHWLYRYIRCSLGHYVQSTFSDRVFREIKSSNVEFIRNDIKDNFKFCCMNDLLQDDDDFDAAKRAVCIELSRLFPNKSQFEL